MIIRVFYISFALYLVMVRTCKNALWTPSWAYCLLCKEFLVILKVLVGWDSVSNALFGYYYECYRDYGETAKFFSRLI